MRESEIKKMTINQLIQQIGIALQPQDVIEMIDISREDLITEFHKGFRSIEEDEYPRYLINFLREHEDAIDKVSMVMLTLENYNEILSENESRLVKSEYTEQIIRWKNRAIEILKDVNKKIYMLQDEEKEKKVKVKVIGSQEIITGNGRKKNSKKLADMEKEGLTLVDLLTSLCLSDLEEVICNRELGELIRFQGFSNAAVKKGLISKDSKYRIVDTQEKIDELVKQISASEVLPEVEEIMKQNIAYIDLDKLLLCSAYRYLEYLEEISEKEVPELLRREVKRILEAIQKSLKGNSVNLEGEIEKKVYENNELKEQSDDEVEYIKISYTVGDLRRDMQKFEGNTYWGKAKIEEVKASLFIGETLLENVNMRRIGLKREELIFLAIENDDNYLYLLENDLLDARNDNENK